MSHLFDEQDLHYMRRALSLAATARGCVEPNPLVGCVIVRNNKLSAKAFIDIGGPHAEADALAGRSIDDVRGSTIYVTLEPCSHFGKTPPCAELLAKYQPARVVIAMEDPFAQVSGRGVQYLESQNIQVHVGVCETEARYLNRAYSNCKPTNAPGFMANGQ